MQFLIEVPVRPQVKVYMERHLGNPARISRNNNIGKYFYLLLDKDPSHKNYKFGQYSERIICNLLDDVYIRAGFALSRTSIVQFNNFMEEEIEGTMFIFLNNYIELSGMTIKNAILTFQERWGFDENSYQFETIKKAYYRYQLRHRSVNHGNKKYLANCPAPLNYV